MTYIHREHNVITNEITEREYDEKEIKQIEKNKEELAKVLAEKNKLEQDKVNAMAKLIALGLTEDEIAAL